MQIREVMSDKPELLQSDSSIGEAARCMRDHDYGLIPVHRDNKLIGIITDRDIAIRAVADGKNADDPIESIVSDTVLYCVEEDEIDQVLKNMQEQNVQRLIVLDNNTNKQLSGIVSLSDIADHCSDDHTVQAVANCCKSYH